MLRSLAIRNFVVVAALDVEFGDGLTVLTGETGAGKSILLDALGLLLGDRFELRQLRAGAERAELAAEFDVSDCSRRRRMAGRAGAGQRRRRSPAAPGARRAGQEPRMDQRPRRRRWRNSPNWARCSSPSMASTRISRSAKRRAQRHLVDAFGGFTTLAREVAERWRAWRAAVGAARRRRACRGGDGRRARVSRGAPARACRRSRSPNPNGASCPPRNRASPTPPT